MNKVIFLGLVILLLSSFVSAFDDYWEQNTLDATVTQDRRYGHKVTELNRNITDITVYKGSLADVDTCKIYNSTSPYTVQATGTFSGNTCDMTFNFADGLSYYVMVMKGADASRTLHYDSTTTTWPKTTNSGLFNITSKVNYNPTGAVWSEFTSSNMADIYRIEATFQAAPTFELTAIEPYNSGAIDTFTARIDNSTTTETINTTNGTILWEQGETINYTAYSSVYHPFTVYNTNTSANSEVTLYKHILTSPANNYNLETAENITFQYNLTTDASTFTSCKLYINSSLISTDTTLSAGINSFFYEFTENGEYEWWVSCNDTESRTRFITVTNVTGPSIISFTPTNTTLTHSEGDTVSFSVSVSSFINYIVTWFKDTVSQATGSVWDFVTGGNDAGDYNITAVVTDSFGQTDSQEWALSVANVNVAPAVSDISISESTIFSNINYYVTCEITDSDTNSEDIIVEMAWGDGSNWYAQTPYYVGSDIWRFNVSTGTHSTDDVLSYRCRGTDNETIPLTSGWYTLPDVRTVGAEQTPPEKPNVLLPVDLKRKYTLPIICADGSDDQSDVQTLYYELQIQKNSTSWESIRNSSDAIVYSYNIADDGYDTTYDLRCRTYDGIEFSAFKYQYNASIKTNIPVFTLTQPGDSNVKISGKSYEQGYFVDIGAIGTDYSVYKVTAECNDDGLLDYAFDHYFSKTANGVFKCINQAGTIQHTINAVIFKNNTNKVWNQICSGLDETQQYCKIEKKYGVVIDE